MTEQAPIYLFADSQPLFLTKNGTPFLASITEHITSDTIKAAYIGASNGDEPVFYEIFTAAMDSIGIHDCRMISALFEPEDQAYLASADVILLAGGDVTLGWKTFQAVGLEEAIRARHHAGAVLIGVSAGAIQLGMRALTSETKAPETDIINTFQIIPFCIGAHEEADDWLGLKNLVTHTKGWRRGLGIPAGGALICYPDQSFEALHQPIQELIYLEEGKVLKESLIIPER
ncbi:MAG: peptidase [Alteromonadaceae bacterium]|nr:MAG: peptidase [Alteromonadaceae bacterium]